MPANTDKIKPYSRGFNFSVFKRLILNFREKTGFQTCFFSPKENVALFLCKIYLKETIL